MNSSETTEVPGYIEVKASPSRAAYLVEECFKNRLSRVTWQKASILTPIGNWTLVCHGKPGLEGAPEICFKVVFTYHPLLDDQEVALRRVVTALTIGDILERH